MPMEITVQDVKFIINLEPYVEGHVCTAGEANALNQTRAENLRNNFAALMKRAASEGRALTQEDFDAYAGEYEFGVRGTGTRVDSLTAELRRMATEAGRARLRAQGMDWKTLSDEDKEAFITAAVEKKREAWTPLALAAIEARKAAREAAAAATADF